MLRRVIAILYEVSSYSKDTGKPVWRSKTVWINIIAIVSILSSKYLGVELSPEEQVSILAIVNFLLRLITKEETGFVVRETPPPNVEVVGKTPDG